MWRFVSRSTKPLSAPIHGQLSEERGVVKFNLRVASPPPGRMICHGQMFLVLFV